MNGRSGIIYIADMDEGTVITRPIAKDIMKAYNEKGRMLTKEETAKIVNQHKRKSK